MDQDNNSDAVAGEPGHTFNDGHDHSAQAAATPTETAPSSDVGDHKLYAILGYILPFLFFLPMVQDSSKNNAFARFHANQQLILLAVWLAVYVLTTVMYSMFMMGIYALTSLLNVGILVLAVIGIINAAQGEMKELPLVGKFKLLDKLFK